MSKRCINCKHCDKHMTIMKKMEAVYICTAFQFHYFEVKPYNLNHCKSFEAKEVLK